MDINKKTVNYLQALSSKMIINANSGHTGIALGASAIFYALFKDHFKFDITGENINRDRFVVSAGHASALYYATMHAFGFDVSMGDLKKFRSINSKTPGHPEIGTIKGIDCSTGPLGQGIANAVGMAISAKRYADIFNVQNFNLFNNNIYCFTGDGCLMEGVALEAISLAGSLKLDNLILLYDKNDNTIDGKLTIANNEDVKAKFESQGWAVIEVKNGNDYKSVSKAIEKCKKIVGKPKIVICNTKIGYGSLAEDNHEIHGRPLTENEYANLIKKLQIEKDFYLPEDVVENCLETTQKNNEYFDDWNKKFSLYENTHPELYKKFLQFNTKASINKDNYNKLFTKDCYTGRDANSILFKEVTCDIPSILGGCADVAKSTKVYADGKFISSDDFTHKNIYFGIREHAMASICNGISLYSGQRSFCSTFFSFSNYMFPAIRMACLMNLPVMYFFTHDSIYVGEDGPTHQPVEQLSQLRQFPNLKVFRPCDCIELVECYKMAFDYNGPSVFVLSKSNQKIYNTISKITKPVKLLTNTTKPDVTLLSSGTDVELCFQAKEKLEKFGIKVDIVSIPCFELFDQLKQNVKMSYLKSKNIIAVEASNDTCWYKYTNNLFNINTYGKSGKGQDVAKDMGWTPEKLVSYIKKVLK